MKNDDNLLDTAAKVFRQRQSANSRFQELFAGGSPVVAAAAEAQLFSAAETSAIELPYTLRLSRSVESAAIQIGEMPPEPPTLRGRVGAILVQAVRRALFWYTGQIRAFQRLVAEAAGEQAVSVQDLGRRQQRQQALLADVLNRFTELKQNHERRWSEFERRSDQRLIEFEHEIEQQRRASAQGQEQRLSDLAHGLERRMDEIERGYERRLSEVEHGQRQRSDELAELIACQERQVQEIREVQERWRNEVCEKQTILATKIGQVDEALAEIQREIDAQGREVRRRIEQERAHLLQQEFRLKMLLREVRKGPSGERGAEAARVIAEEMQHSDDALFVDHARAFRGTRAEIKSRLAVYVPYVKEAFAKTAGAPALDLGCGRGEWLELLREMNIPASGIDWNHNLIKACREMGLDAKLGDIPSVLAEVPDESFSILTAFHVLEHVAFPDLLEVIDQAVRILKPGGIAIFETPNPGNVFVSSNNFYLDPTHRHPIPSDLLAFVIEARGLCDPQVMPLSPYPDSFRLTDSECPAVKFINDHFYGPQDYGVVGFKV